MGFNKKSANAKISKATSKFSKIVKSKLKKKGNEEADGSKEATEDRQINPKVVERGASEQIRLSKNGELDEKRRNTSTKTSTKTSTVVVQGMKKTNKKKAMLKKPLKKNWKKIKSSIKKVSPKGGKPPVHTDRVTNSSFTDERNCMESSETQSTTIQREISARSSFHENHDAVSTNISSREESEELPENELTNEQSEVERVTSFKRSPSGGSNYSTPIGCKISTEVAAESADPNEECSSKNSLIYSISAGSMSMSLKDSPDDEIKPQLLQEVSTCNDDLNSEKTSLEENARSVNSSLEKTEDQMLVDSMNESLSNNAVRRCISLKVGRSMVKFANYNAEKSTHLHEIDNAKISEEVGDDAIEEQSVDNSIEPTEVISNESNERSNLNSSVSKPEESDLTSRTSNMSRGRSTLNTSISIPEEAPSKKTSMENFLMDKYKSNIFLQHLAIYLFQILRQDTVSDEACVDAIKKFCWNPKDRLITQNLESANSPEINGQESLNEIATLSVTNLEKDEESLPSSLDKALRDAMLLSVSMEDTITVDDRTEVSEISQVEADLRNSLETHEDFLNRLTSEKNSSQFDFYSKLEEARKYFEKLTTCV